MTRWLAIGNRDNWKVVHQKNIWGVPERNRNILSRVKMGDTILFYVGQEKQDDNLLPSSIVAECEVITPPYEDTTPIFITPPHMGKEVFAHRIRLKPIKIFKNPVEFKPLIKELTFITNKKMWTGHIRVAMREIPEEDYKLIVNQTNR